MIPKMSEVRSFIKLFEISRTLGKEIIINQMHLTYSWVYTVYVLCPKPGKSSVGGKL